MSKASLASDRPIVRYPDVAAHMMTCPTCKAAGSFEELTYNGGHRACYEGIGLLRGHGWRGSQESRHE